MPVKTKCADTELLVMFGGASSEHDASCAAFDYVYPELKARGSEAALSVAGVAYVGHDGMCALIAGGVRAIHSSECRAVRRNMHQLDVINLARQRGWFVLSLLYGQGAEDGDLQGAISLGGVGSNVGGVLAAAASMDKEIMAGIVSKKVPEALVPATCLVRSRKELAAALAFFAGKEIVVKPNRLGSSVLTQQFVADHDGTDAERLYTEIRRYDRSALVQEYIAGIEYSIGYLETAGAFEMLPVIRVERRGMFDIEQKFSRNQAKEVVIGTLSASDPLARFATALGALAAELNFHNCVRADVIATPDGVVFLEFNANPGLLRGSLYTRMLRASGRSVVEFVAQCVGNADTRTPLQTEFGFLVHAHRR